MDPFEIGAPVRQVVKPITGTVADVTFDAQTRSFRYLVDFVGADGHPGQRWFTAAELETAQ